MEYDASALKEKIRQSDGKIRKALRDYIAEARSLSEYVPHRQKKEYFRKRAEVLLDLVDGYAAEHYAGKVLGASRVTKRHYIMIPRPVRERLKAEEMRTVAFVEGRRKIFVVTEF